MIRTRTCTTVSLATLVLAGAVAAGCTASSSSSPKGSPATHQVHETSAGMAHTTKAKPSSGVGTKPAHPEVSPILVTTDDEKRSLSGAVVSSSGFGPIAFGMTVAQAQSAAGTTVDRRDYSGAGCELGSLPSLPGVTFDITPSNDEIVAVEVSAPASSVKTAAGIGAGSTTASLQAAYWARLLVGSYFYEGNGTTDVQTHLVAMFYVPGSGTNSLAFRMNSTSTAVGSIFAGADAESGSFC
jgi:hypothetical protein